MTKYSRLIIYLEIYSFVDLYLMLCKQAQFADTDATQKNSRNWLEKKTLRFQTPTIVIVLYFLLHNILFEP